MPHPTIRQWLETTKQKEILKRTIPSLATAASRRRRIDWGDANASLGARLQRLDRQVDVVTMTVLELVVYLSGHEKSMSIAEFAARLGVSAGTIRKRIDKFEVSTRRGRIPPSALRVYGVGPTSRWPRE